MAISDDLSDVLAEVRELKRRIRQLETASPLNNASISTGPGIAVRVPDGVNVPDGGSIGVEGDGGVDVKPGGSIDAGDLKVGNTGGAGSLKVGGTEVDATGLKSGGTKILANGDITDSDGELKFLVNVKGVASGNFDGYVRGGLGVEAPLEPGGPMTSLGPAVKEADRKGQSGYDNAIAARDEAAAAGGVAQSAWNLADAAWDEAVAAGNTAQSAWDLANGRVTQAQYTTISGWIKGIGLALDALDKQVGGFHPGKPGLPPYYKG